MWTAFFGLFLDNLLQLMLITALCPWGLRSARRPGGAHHPARGRGVDPGGQPLLRLAGPAVDAGDRPHRCDGAAVRHQHAEFAGVHLPDHGPGLPSTGNPTLAWQAGLLACLLSGLIELAGAFVGEWVRRHTPRAALLSALAGIAITFIAVGLCLPDLRIALGRAAARCC
jgi:adenine/guanine/hypoxanthine permease